MNVLWLILKKLYISYFKDISKQATRTPELLRGTGDSGTQLFTILLEHLCGSAEAYLVLSLCALCLACVSADLRSVHNGILWGVVTLLRPGIDLQGLLFNHPGV